MRKSLSEPGIASPDDLAARLARELYLAGEELATASFLALKLGKPLLLEGLPGVGKTEAAKALASALGVELIRLHATRASMPATRFMNGITRASCWRCAVMPPQISIRTNS